MSRRTLLDLVDERRLEDRALADQNRRVKRPAAIVVAVVAACGGTRAPSTVSSGQAAVDAATAAVAEVERPEVPPQVRSADVVELRARIAGSSDAGEQLILLGQLVEAEWAASCPDAIDGLCLRRMTRLGSAPATCDAHAEDVIVSPRAEQRVEVVLELIGGMRERWRDGAVLHEITDPQAETDAYIQNAYMAEEVAAALLIFAHLEAEAFLAIPRPSLDFNDRDSLKEAKTWRSTLWHVADQAIERYRLVAHDPELRRWSPRAAVEAVGRIASMHTWKGSQMRGLDIPKGFAGAANMGTAFCEALEKELVPHDELAADEFERCVKLATDTGVTSPWADRCAAELKRLSP